MEEIGSEKSRGVSRCEMRISHNETPAPAKDASLRKFNVEIRQ